MLVSKDKIFAFIIFWFCIIGVCISIPYAIIPMFVCIIVMCAGKMCRFDKFILVSFSFVLLVCLIWNIVSFNFIPQALYLYDINPNVYYWFAQGHLHAIRLFLAYPGVLLSTFFELDLNLGFGIYVVVLFEIMMFIVLRIMGELNIGQKFFRYLASLFLLALAYVMNGRIVFSFVGVMILVYIDFLHRRGEIGILTLHFFTVIGFVLSSVSSGTMLLISIYILIETILRLKYIKSAIQKRKYILSLFLMFLPVAAVIVPYLEKMLMKNVRYFGGGLTGVISLIQHGLGKIFFVNSVWFLCLVLVLGIMVFFVNMIVFWKKYVQTQNEYISLYLLINLGMYGIFVGISTGMIALIPLFLIVCKKLCKRYNFVLTRR